jgi:hypothetical protein
MNEQRDVEAFVLQIMRNMYKRPYMYGNEASAIMAQLLAYHGVVAFVRGQSNDLADAAQAIRERENCGPYNILDHYRNVRTEAFSEGDAIDYVISYWQEIDQTLGFPV